MYWTKESYLHLYKLDKNDSEYKEEVRNRTNILAMVYKNEYRKRFVLTLGGVGGALKFKYLKDAKELVEKYYAPEISSCSCSKKVIDYE